MANDENEGDITEANQTTTLLKQTSQVIDQKLYGQRIANALLKIIIADEAYLQLSNSDQPKSAGQGKEEEVSC